MEAQQIVYDICRHYLTDRKATLSESTVKTLSGYIRSRSYRKLASCATSFVHDITCAESARTLLQIEAFFKKNAIFTDPVEARLAALLSFEEGEERCALTNNRLDKPLAKSEKDLLQKMERYIDHVLGDFGDFVSLIPNLVQVTSGATATRSRRRARPFMKVNKRMVCTPGAFPILDALSRFWGYGSLAGRLVSRNRIAFVPKSWKTERTIACEPDGNVSLQLAFDSYAKHRLRLKSRINLRSQTRNQELAKEGSILGNFATVDLSMASDTLSYNVVAALFSREWFSYLRSIRSQYYEMYPGNRTSYHKFSSMGNGATFAIETLVFAAACHAVGSKDFSVYGDDIIIETEYVHELLALLDFLGFVPNTDKTFIEGPIRESCGSFWYSGVDILPTFIREIDRRKTTKCHLVNSLAAICEPYGALESYLVEFTLQEKLPFVPYNESTISGVWLDTHTAYAKKLIRSKTYAKGRYVETWIPKFKSYVSKTPTRRDLSIRSLFLWYLGTQGRERVRDPYQSSRYPISSHKYVRKWVHWKPVVNGPGHLYRWSDNFTTLL